MNILNIQLPKNHFHSLLHFAQSENHNAYTNWHGDTAYENLCGIHTLTPEDNTFLRTAEPMEMIAYMHKFIDYYNIDILQVADPTKAWLHTFFHDQLKYIGPPESVARLETDKLYAKEMAESVGIKTPRILKQGKYFDNDYANYSTFPTIEKPSHVWAPAVNIFNKDDCEHLIKLRSQGIPPRDTNADYFVEEYITDMIETNVFFVIANGEYRITHTQQIIGEDENKSADPKVWYIGSYIQPLKPEVDTIVREKAGLYLEEIAKMGGSYEGSFCGAYTSAGDWYFLEINVRPDIFNSTPTFMSADDYVKGYFEDINLFDKAWENKTCDKLLITSLHKGEEYPFHLHQKYDVSIPNNLEYIDNKFYVSGYGTDNEKGCGTIIADYNIPKEFVKEIEATTHWKFNEEPSG